MNHNCSDCGQSIPAGLAHVRSVSLERVFLCGFCLELRRAESVPVVPAIPAQRRGGTLAERIAAAR